jgi:hypothetical protein
MRWGVSMVSTANFSPCSAAGSIPARSSHGFTPRPKRDRFKGTRAEVVYHVGAGARVPAPRFLRSSNGAVPAYYGQTLSFLEVSLNARTLALAAALALTTGTVALADSMGTPSPSPKPSSHMMMSGHSMTSGHSMMKASPKPSHSPSAMHSNMMMTHASPSPSSKP